MPIIKASCPNDVILIESNEIGSVLTEDGNYKKLFKKNITSVVVFDKYKRKYLVIGTPRKVTFTASAGLALDTINIK